LYVHDAIHEQLALSGDDDHSTHLHHHYQKVTLSTEKPIDPMLWEKFLESLPDGIYRAKGFLYFGMKGLEQKFVFQLVGARHEMKLDEWVGKTPKTDLVFIGTDLDEADLRRKLEGLIDAAPNVLDNKTIMDVLQYK
jgi:G3E family GTPase